MTPLRWALVAIAVAAVAATVFWGLQPQPEPETPAMTLDDVLGAYGVEPVSEEAAKADAASFTSAQPPEEREKQNSLPKSAHPLWEVLNKSTIHYSNEEPHITISLTEAAKALVGKQTTITGFVLPLDDGQSTGKTKRFLLSQRTPTCTWCPPGEPNEVVQVTVGSELDWKADELRVTGPFSLTNNTNNGIFYHISATEAVYQ